MPLDATNGRNIVKDQSFIDTNKLLTALDEGTYNQIYSIGDTLTLTLSNTLTKATYIIIGKDIDIDSDNKTIPLTLISKAPFGNMVTGNESGVRSWANQATRNTLNNLYNSLTWKGKDRIVASKRITASADFYGRTNQLTTTYDKLTIPSCGEFGVCAILNGSMLSSYPNTTSNYYKFENATPKYNANTVAMKKINNNNLYFRSNNYFSTGVNHTALKFNNGAITDFGTPSNNNALLLFCIR